MGGGDIEADWVFKSSTSLGGDTFCYHDIDGENFAAYLIDVCGHGVGAALLSVSVVNVLRSQSLDKTDFREPGQVMRALNNAFDMDTQNGMYFTMWYGVFNRKTRRLTYACGGHPPAVLVNKAGAEELRGARGMVVGGMPGVDFETKCADIESGARLYVFSDGAYEINPKEGGEMMSVEEFAHELAAPASGGLTKVESMLKFSKDFQGCEQFADDFSLFELKFK